MSTANEHAPLAGLRRALAERARALADGAAVDARDLGCVPSATPNVTADGVRLPYVVVTPELHAALARESSAGPGEDGVFAGERAVRDANAADQAYADGDDAADWDTDDGPANLGDWENEADDRRAEDALHERAAAAASRGVARSTPGYGYRVGNPFNGRDRWFQTAADATAYARATSALDALDGDLGVWSASGPGHHALFKGGAPYREA